MFGPAGRLYVYFSYGMHWCANVVCGPEGEASAVLLRAAQPLGGVDLMRQARSHGQKSLRDRDLCRGPARLAEAFGITGSLNGTDLVAADSGGADSGGADSGGTVLWLAGDGSELAGRVVTTPRVGLSATRAPGLPWRYVLAGSPWASGPVPQGG